MNMPPSHEPLTSSPPQNLDLLKRLRLPEHYDHKQHAQFIPTHSDLQRAAVYALNEWTAFLVLHQDEPAVIAEHLTELADIVKAACGINGDHRVWAIHLGLELDPWYWWGQNKVDEMPGLIIEMLTTALDIGDQRLISRVYRMWSVYLYLTQDQPKSKKALDMALEYAEDSAREDLALLAKIERFNLDIADMPLVEAKLKASQLLSAARNLNYTYAQGRVYLSLARACHHAALPHETFMYAQQAFAVFVNENLPELAGQAIDEMLGSLQQQSGHSPIYISRLFAYLEVLMESSVNPWLQAAVYHHQAVHHLIQKQYDRARTGALKAWLHYRKIRQKASCISVIHMLGLIQTKRQCWNIAAHHLSTATDFYGKMDYAVLAVQAQHALAYIPFEKGDFERACAELKTVLSMAKKLPEEGARERLVQLIQDDLNDAASRI